MLYLLFRFLINAVAILVTFLVFPLEIVSHLGREATTIDLVVMLGIGSVILGLINTFIRPIVLFLTGRLYIWSLGLISVLTNTLLLILFLAITSSVTETEWQVKLFWLPIIAVSMTTLVYVLEGIMGIDSPTLEGPQDNWYWGWLEYLPLGRRNRIIENLRTAQVYDTIMRYARDIMIDASPFAPFRQFWQRAIYRKQTPIIDESVPETIRLMLQELGPTYVKVGQLVSSRAAVLPLEWQAELAKLQSTVEPFPYEEARDIIIGELGNEPEKIYKAFNKQPFAAASLGQAHFATLQDGIEVVVKVQRPNVVAKINADLGVMERVAETMQKRFEFARAVDLVGIVSEFAENVVLELDYQNEAYNSRRLNDVLRDFDDVRVPYIYGAYSTGRVLTMERAYGVQINQRDKIIAAGIDPHYIAERYMNAMIKQVLFEGFFHGDPHPGNIWVDTRNGDIIFLDFGMVGMLDSEQRTHFIEMLWSLSEHDAYELTKSMMRMCNKITRDEVNVRELTQKVDMLVKRYLIYSEEEGGGFAEVVTATMAVLYQYGLRMKQEYTLAIKAMMQSEETARILYPEMEILTTGVAQIRGLMLEQLNFDNVKNEVQKQATRTARELVRRVPTLEQAALSWLDQFEKGKFVVNIDTSDLTQHVESIETILRRLTIALITGGLVIGSAIATLIPIEIIGVPLSVIGLVVFVIASVVALYTLFRLLVTQDLD